MKQFGGQGRKKKACSMRKCSAQSVETMTSAVHGTGTYICMFMFLLRKDGHVHESTNICIEIIPKVLVQHPIVQPNND